ncbi:MAG: hypothetical protein ACLP8X_15430 [Streptosporangiaceae bacterium]
MGSGRDDPGGDQAGRRRQELRDDPGGLVRIGKREIYARHASRLLH